jgi:hypothetical protein
MLNGTNIRSMLLTTAIVVTMTVLSLIAVTKQAQAGLVVPIEFCPELPQVQLRENYDQTDVAIASFEDGKPVVFIRFL